MFVGEVIGLILTCYSASLDIFLLVWSNATPGICSYEFFVDWLGLNFVYISIAGYNFITHLVNWRLGRHFWLASDLRLFIFCWFIDCEIFTFDLGLNNILLFFLYCLWLYRRLHIFIEIIICVLIILELIFILVDCLFRRRLALIHRRCAFYLTEKMFWGSQFISFLFLLLNYF